jgi:hypothetical protein
LVTRCNCKSRVQVSSKFKDSKKKFYQILLNFKLRCFFEFSFKIHLEYEEDPMEKVVSCLKPFTTIFYLKFSEPVIQVLVRVKFASVLSFIFEFLIVCFSWPARLSVDSLSLRLGTLPSPAHMEASSLALSLLPC